MDRVTHLDHLDRDGRRLAEAVANDLAAAVPFCEGWTARHVVEHVADVYDRIRCTVEGKEPDPSLRASPADREPLEWFTEATPGS
jgi:hypothetical protein